MRKPKFVYDEWAKDTPLNVANPSQYEKDKFLDEENQKWLEGYDGMTGYHYFELSQCKIKNARGKEIRPFWRESDEFVHSEYTEGIKSQEDILYAKRRGFGLTSVFGGVIPVCNTIIYPGSTNLITSADKPRIKSLFLEKTCVVYDNLHPWIKPNRASSRQEGFMYLAKKDSKGGYSGLKSSIISSETVTNPAAFENYRAQSVFLDEFFLHPYASKVRESSQACVSDDLLKISSIVMGGSCGAASSEGLKEAAKIWEDSSALGIRTVFIPGFMGISNAQALNDEGKPTGEILNFCPNGYDDVEGATEWIKKTRDRLQKAKNQSPYLRFIREYPLTIEEFFSVTGEGIFKEYPQIPPMIQSQKIYILNSPPPVNTYHLHRNSSNKIETEVHPEGKFVLLEKAQPNTTYISGSDPIPFNTENIEQGSDYAIVIKKPLANTYVGYYKERNLDSDAVIRNCILLQDHFNQAKTLFEVNRGGVAKKTYKDLGRQDLLAKRPEALGIQFVDKTETFGYYKTGHTAQRGVQLFINYLLKHTDKIFFKEILNELNQFLIGNTDLIDAMIACEFQDANIIELAKKYTPTVNRQQFSVWEQHNGIKQQIWYWRYADGRVEKC